MLLLISEIPTKNQDANLLSDALQRRNPVPDILYATHLTDIFGQVWVRIHTEVGHMGCVA